MKILVLTLSFASILFSTSGWAAETCVKLSKIEGIGSDKIFVTTERGERIQFSGDKSDLALMVAAQGTAQTVCFSPGNLIPGQFWLSSISK